MAYLEEMDTWSKGTFRYPWRAHKYKFLYYDRILKVLLKASKQEDCANDRWVNREHAPGQISSQTQWRKNVLLKAQRNQCFSFTLLFHRSAYSWKWTSRLCSYWNWDSLVPSLALYSQNSDSLAKCSMFTWNGGTNCRRLLGYTNRKTKVPSMRIWSITRTKYHNFRIWSLIQHKRRKNFQCIPVWFLSGLITR